MGIRVDLTGAEIKDFDPIPAGTYLATVTDGEVRDNKDGPTEKNPTGKHINWEFTIKDHPEYSGRHQWRNTPLGGDGIGILKELLLATGKWTEDELDGEFDFNIHPDDNDPAPHVVGCDVLITVRRRNYEGEPRNDVSKVRPVGAEMAAAGDSSLLP